MMSKENKKKTIVNRQNCLFMVLGFAMSSLNHYYTYNMDSMKTFVQNPIERKSMPNISASVFRPIHVYSNRELANEEVPERSTVKRMNTNGRLPYSQAFQDKIILALTKANDEKSSTTVVNEQKFFVDLAANHALNLSNTLYLEQNDWNGVCIEGNPDYWYDLGRYRMCSIVGAFVGGKPSEDGKQVEVALRGVLGGIAAEGMDNAKQTNTVSRELVSINTVFQEMNVPSMIDYLSLDVEGAESLVMHDFPWDQYRFRFLTVERPKDDLKALFEANGYIMITRITSWGETLWAHKESINLSQDEMIEIITHAPHN